MATVETEVYDVLRNAAAVTALCPAARIKPPGNWQNLTRSYIVHFPVALRQARTHDGLKGRLWDSYQVSVFADDYTSGRNLADAVVAALDGVSAGGANFQFQSLRVFQDPEVNVIHFVLEFLCGETL